MLGGIEKFKEKYKTHILNNDFHDGFTDIADKDIKTADYDALVMENLKNENYSNIHYYQNHLYIEEPPFLKKERKTDSWVQVLLKDDPNNKQYYEAYIIGWADREMFEEYGERRIYTEEKGVKKPKIGVPYWLLYPFTKTYNCL